jgi:ABC-2 type transport system permease protein
VMRAIIVAGYEFRSTMRNPLVLVSIILLLAISVISAYGFTLNAFSSNQGQGTSLLSVFMTSLGGNAYEISSIFLILSVCLGVFSIVEERHGGTLGVLISKPVYRRDVILGKFIGLSGFLLMAISLVLAIRVSTALILHPMPAWSFTEIFARIASLGASLFLYCVVMLGISMMVGVLFKNIALAIALSATIVYVEWFTPLLAPLNILNPKILYLHYLWGRHDNNFIFSVSSPYLAWLSSVFPYFILLAAEAIIVLLIDCVLFSREEA